VPSTDLPGKQVIIELILACDGAGARVLVCCANGGVFNLCAALMVTGSTG
jgi:hypothetical protein